MTSVQEGLAVRVESLALMVILDPEGLAAPLGFILVWLESQVVIMDLSEMGSFFLVTQDLESQEDLARA